MKNKLINIVIVIAFLEVVFGLNTTIDLYKVLFTACGSIALVVMAGYFKLKVFQ